MSTTQPLFQHDFYSNNLCHFDNKTSYPLCNTNLNEYYDWFQCDDYLTANYTSHNPSYFAFSESYRDVPELKFREEIYYGDYTALDGMVTGCDYFYPVGEGIWADPDLEWVYYDEYYNTIPAQISY